MLLSSSTPLAAGLGFYLTHGYIETENLDVHDFWIRGLSIFFGIHGFFYRQFLGSPLEEASFFACPAFYYLVSGFLISLGVLIPLSRWWDLNNTLTLFQS